MKYHDFLNYRLNSGAQSGFEPVFMPKGLFDFQEYLVTWAIEKGRGALFEDCGMGKTFQQLVWAENVARKFDKPVLILTPLAVSGQVVSEGEKFGIEVIRSKDGEAKGRLTVTNYEKLHMFDPSDFSGVVCDESSILKSFAGARKDEITKFMKKTPYRLLASATPSPNDFTELGTSSEALGYLGHMDMLNKFFKNDLNNSATGRMYGEAVKWRLKGHAELPFWRWVTSWARACQRPSDLGFEDCGFALPELIENIHMVDLDHTPDGFLFNLPASTLPEQREERKRSLQERCEMAAELANHGKPVNIWCHMNEEGDLLERLIPDSVQVSGKDSDDRKEEKFEEFSKGNARVMITKPKIGAWGLNWQHCSNVVYFPSHSYEQYYQAIRRNWRFGQKNKVTVDMVVTEGERKVLANLQRKSNQAEEMFKNLVAEMNNALGIRKTIDYTNKTEVPKWL